ncbi:MAG TPA: FUSC family protein [Pseudonocardiaceae bacterium]|nr:FUSC family protein [Pseudonocardiaceae bacterium]
MGARTGREIKETRPDVAPPHWLTQLLKPRPAPIDWTLVARATLTLPATMAVGMATGHLALGVLASIGSLFATVTAVSGPYRHRFRRAGMVMVACGLGLFVGDLVGERGWWTTAFIVGVAVVSAVVSAASNNASVAGLQLLVGSILGTHESTLASPWVMVAAFATGSGWAMLVALAAWPLRATAPERRLVVAVYDGVVAMLDAAGTAAARPARQQLTTALNAAYDALLNARSRLHGRDLAYRRLFDVLSETTAVVEAAVALVNARHRPPRSVVNAVAAVGQAIRDDARPPALDLPERGSPGVLALADGLRTVVRTLADEGPGRARARRPSRRERIEEWFDQVIAGPTTWLHALRLAICLAIAETLAITLQLDRSYWVPLTVAVVLKPDLGSVFGRAVLRGGGTAVGALIGAGVLALNPNGWVLVGLVAVIGFLLPIAQARSYGMLATALTPMIVIQLDLGHAGHWDLVLTRLLDTLAGCAIVLIFGYLLWPGSRTPRIGDRLADAVDAVARYADRALRADPRGRSALRRRTYRQLADLRTEFQRVLVEPSAAGRQAAAWYPAIVGLERLTSTVTRVAVEIDRGAAVPAADDIHPIVSSLHDLAGAVRDQRRPADPPSLPAGSGLAAVAEDVAGVVSALRGPDLDSARPFSLVRRLLPGGGSG